MATKVARACLRSALSGSICKSLSMNSGCLISAMACATVFLVVVSGTSARSSKMSLYTAPGL